MQEQGHSSQLDTSKCFCFLFAYCIKHTLKWSEKKNNLQTIQEIATVTKTKYLIDLLFMQEVSTNPSSAHLRRNALVCTADAR